MTTAPAERPLLFSAPMIRALLEGRKTQTRRVAKLDRPRDLASEQLEDFEIRGFEFRRQSDGTYLVIPPCPYGQRGDRLWIREAHAIVPASAYRMSRDDGAPIPHAVSPDGQEWAVYREGWSRSRPRWRPSIFMPRWASRILLEIVEVRLERLQAISEIDAIDEGVMLVPNPPAYQRAIEQWVADGRPGKPPLGPSPAERYRHLWDSLNARRGAGWDANPWIWALTFRRIKP